jgi:hypothetical protein
VKYRLISGAWLALLCVTAAQAQLNLPNLPATARVPAIDLPVGGVTRAADRIANTAADQASNALTNLRRTQIRTLISNNPDVIEADPNGAPIVRREVVGMVSVDATLAVVRSAGFSVVSDQVLGDTGLRMVTLSVPTEMTTPAALQRLRTLDPLSSYDFNHIYTRSGTSNNTAATTTPTPAHDNIIVNNEHVHLGLIDGGVDTTHPALAGSRIHTWGCDGQHLANDHGTAVASIMVGHDAQFSGAAVGATLYAADVYCNQPAGGAMTTILSAFAWMAQQQVPVINISLVGPENKLLENMMQYLSSRGFLIVAAVGNDGPAAPPLYPASYPGVIGVTAVDAHDRVLPEAARGKQVAYAAPGADMLAASTGSNYASVRGTSFAAPVVAGLLGQYLSKPDPADTQFAITTLDKQAIDLGARGVDKIYGRGLVGKAVRVALDIHSVNGNIKRP